MDEMNDYPDFDDDTPQKVVKNHQGVFRLKPVLLALVFVSVFLLVLLIVKNLL